MDSSQLKKGQEVIILGTSGFAVEISNLLTDFGVKVKGCIGPEPLLNNSNVKYLGKDEVIPKYLEFSFIVAIGNPNIRRRLFEDLEKVGGRIACFIHPSAYVSSTVSNSEGLIIYPNATIHAGATLGRGVLVNSNATVGHETSIGAFSNIGPGVSLGGRAHIGENVYFGIGASMIENITVVNETVVGAGAVVIRDCIPCGIYVGVPAYRLDS